MQDSTNEPDWMKIAGSLLRDGFSAKLSFSGSLTVQRGNSGSISAVGKRDISVKPTDSTDPDQSRDVSDSAGGSFEVPPGTAFTPAEAFVSSDGRYRLRFQEDGNLVVYRVSDNFPTWALQKVRIAYRPGLKAEFTTDGQLVVTAADETVVWRSPSPRTSDAQLAVDSKGSLQILTRAGDQLWPARSGTTSYGFQAG